MQRTKANKKSAKGRIGQYKDRGMVEEYGKLFCTYCGVGLKNNKFQIDQHLKTKKHEENHSLKMKQPSIPGMRNQNIFAQD